MNARPEQDALESRDNGAADKRIGKTLQRSLYHSKDEFRESGRTHEVAETVNCSTERKENHARSQGFKSLGYAAGNCGRHLDADVILLTVAEHPGNDETNENRGDNAVAACPGLGDDVVHNSTALGCHRGRQENQESGKGQNRSHHGIAAFTFYIFVSDGQNGNQSQHTERSTGNSI